VGDDGIWNGGKTRRKDDDDARPKGHSRGNEQRHFFRKVEALKADAVGKCFHRRIADLSPTQR